MSIPYEIVKCSNCDTLIYAGATSCYKCGEKTQWKKDLDQMTQVLEKEGKC